VVFLHGVYSFQKKVVAYRNDFCLTCHALRRAVRTRSFKVIHLFYIPLFPLGFWREWHCQYCGHDPHRVPGVRNNLKWAAVLGLAMIAGVGWLDDRPADSAIWVVRIGASLAAIAMAVYTIRAAPDTQLKSMLQQVAPADEMACALCGGALMRAEEWQCSQCGAERLTVKI
jgi:hypothetical protein